MNIMSRKQHSDGDTRFFINDESVSTLLISLGIPAHILGFQYLQAAIYLTIKTPTVIHQITRELYPAVATMCDTQPAKVERAIRHAINLAWDRDKLFKLNTYYGLDVLFRGQKPTNSELVALLAHLKSKIGKDSDS
jgi:two-component system response regulator (stage 0 sporulation protein A)